MLLPICLGVLSWAWPLEAALLPGEVAILAVRSSKGSQEIAEYYARARGVPIEQICLLDIKPGETLSRDDWEQRVRPAIRRWLAQKKLESKIRCMVTVWDVPLKIGPIDPAHPAVDEIRENLDLQRSVRQGQVVRLAAEIDQVLAAGDAPARAAPAADAPHKAYADLLEMALEEAQKRLKTAQETQSPGFAPGAQQLERLYAQGGGTSALLRSIESQIANSPKPPVELLRGFEYRRGELIGLRGGIAALFSMRESADRDQQSLALIQKSDGVLGALAWIEQARELWRKNETYSSFDSELALLLFPPYALVRWQTNPLHTSVDVLTRESLPKTLMVARLEAPTIELVRKAIDASISAEAAGLAGTMYIDARGMAAEKSPGSGSYADFDQSLRVLARLFTEHTGLKVVFDDRDTIFQPGDCPDAALYCGWYSLGKYVDAFTWKPGAVGYHLASAEAATLRDLKSTVWCKRMLESGVCATLGPTYEPYLAAFPRPLEFFALLATGNYTLAETYARTNPFQSWVMVLVGDPLYNPFKNRPLLDERRLPEMIAPLLDDRR